MKRYSIFVLFFVSFFLSCIQVTREKKETARAAETEKAEDGPKEGVWTEMVRDSATGRIEKHVGKYSSGKKDSTWTTYYLYQDLPRWRRRSTTTYKNGLKNGIETLYLGSGDSEYVYLIRHWKDDAESGIGKMYYFEPPHGLSVVYDMRDGEQWNLEGYYPSGKIESEFSDTFVNGKALRFCREYYESGQLKSTCFFDRDKMTGPRKIYYENGQLQNEYAYSDDEVHGRVKFYFSDGQIWSEQVYEKGKLMNVLYNYDKSGKRKDPGTLRNGNGVVYVYDEAGNLEKKVKYVDGMETKE